MTPNFLMLVKEFRLPIEVMFGRVSPNTTEIACYGEYVDSVREGLQKAHDIARQHLCSTSKRQKETYDAKLAYHKFHVGDLVWFYSDATQLKIAPKLRCPYEGPFLVVQKLNDLDYLIQFDAKGKRRVVHHNRLKPYFGKVKLKWPAGALKKGKAGCGK